MKFLLAVQKRRITHGLFSSLMWLLNGVALPSTNFVKHLVLRRFFLNNGITIETGTYFGETTKRLSEYSSQVISLEPEESLYFFSSNRLKRHKNVKVVNASSEEYFSKIIDSLPKNSDVNFWLDGHYSGGDTFKGDTESPISKELKVVSENQHKFRRLRLAIDDFRDFGHESTSGYLSRNELVEWAKENGFFWNVELDIFLMSKDNDPS